MRLFPRPTSRPLGLRRRGLAGLAAVVLAALAPVVSPARPVSAVADPGATAPAAAGYWMVATDGGVFSYGSARFLGGVRAIALSGDTLFIGGSFKKIGNVDVPSQVAALDAATGALRTGWLAPENTGGRFIGHTGTPTEDGNSGLIYDMKVSADGRYLFVGGDFLHFGGQGGLLTIDAATGAASTWQAIMDHPRPVFGLDVWAGDGRSVIVATGGTGGTAQFFDTGGDVKPKWIGRVDGDGTDVVSTPSRVYLVGHYDHEVPNQDDPCLKHVPVTCSDGTPHRKLAAFDPVTGHADPSFTAQGNTPQGPYVALVGRDHLFVGGDFTEIGPPDALRPQPGFAAFDRISEPGPAPPAPPTTTTVATSSTTTTTG